MIGPPCVAGDGPERRVALERRHLTVATALPLVVVTLVAAVRCVHPDQDFGLGHPGPERVELGQGRGPRSPEAPDRSGADQDDPSPPLEHPVQLLDGPSTMPRWMTGVGNIRFS